MKNTGSHFSRFGAAYGFIGGVVSTVLVLMAFVWYGLLSYPLPWKVTDPASPYFDASDFEFSDYQGEKQLQEALEKMFPAGTKRSEVEKTLVKVGRARSSKNSKPKSALKINLSDQIYRYEYRNYRSLIYEVIARVPEGEFGWKMTIVYDDQDNLISIYVI